MGERISNYDSMKYRMAADFAGRDTAALARKLGLIPGETHISVTLLGQAYRVDRRTGAVTGPAGREADFDEAMLLYDLLACSVPGAAAAGEYVPIQRLSRIENASSYAGRGMVERMGAACSGRTEALRRAGAALGWEPFGRGDVSLRAPVFGDLCGVFSFWEADEDFPAAVNLYFDRNILQFMHYETVWYAAGLMNRRLREAMDGSGV